MLSDHISKVHNDEGSVGHPWFTKVRALLQVMVVKLPGPVLIRAFRHLERSDIGLYTLIT